MIMLSQIIIIANMKKIDNDNNPYNFNKKEHKINDVPKTTQDLRSYDRNNKISEKNSGNTTRIQKEYYPQSARTSEASCSIVINDNLNKLEKQDEQTKASKDKSNNSSYFSTKAQLQNQIERLTILLERKDQELSHIVKNQEKKKVKQKIIQSEMVELHKIINFHKGQIQNMEAQLRNYELCFIKISRQCDQRSKYKSQVEQLVELFQSMRKQNEDLSGSLKQKTYQLNKLTQKYVKIKQKLNHSLISKQKPVQQKIITKNLSQSKLKLRKSQSLSKRVYDPIMPQKQRMNYIWTLQAKIQLIQSKITEISKQNQKLFSQIDSKQQLISLLQFQLKSVQQKNKQKQQVINSLNKKHGSQKKIVHKVHKKQSEISKFQNGIQHQILYQKLRNTLGNTLGNTIFWIIIKLRYKLMASQVSYESLIDNLTDIQLKYKIFTQEPYNLNIDQYQNLLKWSKQIRRNTRNSISNFTLEIQIQKLKANLRSLVPKFKNLTFKKQFTIKRLIYNQYLNRQNEFKQVANSEKFNISFDQADDYFKSWGLSKQQRDILIKSYFELTNNIQIINLQVLGGIMAGWELL